MTAAVQPGDYALLHHDMMFDRFLIRRITKVNTKTVETERIQADSDGYTHPKRRNRTAIIGIFSSKENAEDAHSRLEPLYRQYAADQKAIKQSFNIEIRELVK